MKTYMVGGAVRDKLLGVTPKDIDYVVVGATPEQMLSLGFKQVGADFPVFLHPTSGEEYALARKERKSGHGHKGFITDFNPSVTIEQDLWRRDLTINAMAIDIETNELIDPYGGQRDLQDEVLRHVSSHFEEDPLRVLRVARLAARLNFEVAPSLLYTMANMVKRGYVDDLTPERVWKEISRGIMEPYPHRMYEILHLTGASGCHDVYPYVGVPPDECKELLAHKLASSLDIRVALMAHPPAFVLRDDVCVPSKIAKLISTVLSTIELLTFYAHNRTAEGTRYQILKNVGVLGSYRNTDLFDNFVAVATILSETNNRPADMDGIRSMLRHAEQIRKIDNEQVIKSSTLPPAESIKQAILTILRHP